MSKLRNKSRNLIIIEEGSINLRYGHLECVGKRSSMEDATVILGDIPIENYNYFAIFDGHGGSEASQYAAENVHLLFRKHFISNQDSDIFKALDQAVQEVNNYLIQHFPTQGSVLCVVIVTNDSVYSYNIGDVRAVIVYPDGKAERISHDHRANDPEEAKVIESKGAEF